jgi:hypothetical protein
MAYTQTKNLKSLNYYRWDESVPVFQTIAENSKFLNSCNGNAASLKISSIQSSVAAHPDQWETMSSTEWDSVSSDAVTTMISEIEAPAEQDAYYYFCVLNESSYRWSVSEEKFQLAGTDGQDFVLFRSLTGSYASNQILLNTNLTNKQPGMWIPINSESFAEGASAAISKLQEKF